MPRKKSKEQRMTVAVRLPVDMVDEISFHIFDTKAGRVKYGAMQQLIEQALRRWLDEKRGQASEDVPFPTLKETETND